MEHWHLKFSKNFQLLHELDRQSPPPPFPVFPSIERLHGLNHVAKPVYELSEPVRYEGPNAHYTHMHINNSILPFLLAYNSDASTLDLHWHNLLFYNIHERPATGYLLFSQVRWDLQKGHFDWWSRSCLENRGTKGHCIRLQYGDGSNIPHIPAVQLL